MNAEEAEHLQELVRANKRRLHKLELQAATFGVRCPPEILNEIEDIQANIEDFERQISRKETGSYRDSSDVLKEFRKEIDSVENRLQQLIVEERRVYRFLGAQSLLHQISNPQSDTLSQNPTFPPG